MRCSSSGVTLGYAAARPYYATSVVTRGSAQPHRDSQPPNAAPSIALTAQLPSSVARSHHPTAMPATAAMRRMQTGGNEQGQPRLKHKGKPVVFSQNALESASAQALFPSAVIRTLLLCQLTSLFLYCPFTLPGSSSQAFAKGDSKGGLRERLRRRAKSGSCACKTGKTSALTSPTQHDEWPGSVSSHSNLTTAHCLSG